MKRIKKTSVPQMKDGGKALSPEDAAIANVLMNRNKGKNFVDRAYNWKTAPVLGNKTHYMAYDDNRVYPIVVQYPGAAGLTQLSFDDAYNYADTTGQYIQAPTSKIAGMLSEYGYKKASGMPTYKNGGITYTGTNRPADKVHYTPQQMQSGGKAKKAVVIDNSDVPTDGMAVDPNPRMYLSGPKMRISDPRKIRATTQQPINPNVDLLAGKYSQRAIGDIALAARKQGVDPYTLEAIAMHESGFGKINDDLGRAGRTANTSYAEGAANIYAQKVQDAKRLGIANEVDQIQLYNGTGRIPYMEGVKKIYGVPLPKEGIDMQQNPLYGKQIMDIRDNVLRKNPQFIHYVDSVYNSIPPKKWDGGPIRYTNTANKPATVITTQSPGYVPQYSIGEQYMMEHPQQYMRSAEGYVTPQQQRDHDYLRTKMYQQEADERANREFAQKMRPGSELADKILTAEAMMSGAGIVNKGLRGISKKVAKKLADDVVPYSGNFPAAYTKGVRGNTPMPTITEVPQLTKEQQILQSYGVNPYGQKTPYTEDEAVDAINASWMRMVNPPKKNITQVPMFIAGKPKKGEIFEQGKYAVDPNIGAEYYPLSTYGRPHRYEEKLWYKSDAENYAKGDEWMMRRDETDGINRVLKNNHTHYTNFGPVTPYQRKYEGKGMPKSLIPNKLQQNQYGGAIMKKKQKVKNGKVLKAEKGAAASNLLDNPMGQTPTGISVPVYNNLYQPSIPQEVSNEFQNYQATQMNDPYANQGQLNKGVAGVSPDVIDQYQAPQPPQQKPAGTIKAGPNFNINTADMVAGTLQGINAILPWQQPKQNKNLYNPAVQNFNNGTGSHASFAKGGGIHIKPENRGKFNATKKKTGKTTEELTHSKNPITKKRAIFAQNSAKWNKKADGGDINNGDAIGNLRQGFSDQNYVSDESLNHGTLDIGDNFATIQQNMIDLQGGKLGRFGQLATSAPMGISKVDSIRGSKTSAYKFRDAQWQYNHNGQLQDTYNAGKNYEQGIAQDLARTNQQWGTIPGQQATTPQEVASQNWVSNDQGLDVWGNQHNYNKYMKETPEVVANAPTGLPANYTGNYMGKNYIGGKEDIPIAAHGAILPAGNGVNIQGKYQPLSGQTIELKDSSHANGGQLVAANGTVIEAEGPNGDGQGGETLHVDQEGNTIVGGNLYVPYTGIKYKKAFKEIGKAEAKIGGMQKKLNKQKEKTTIIANNITDPKNRYGAPTAGTVAVLADAHAQEEQGIMQMEEQVSNLKQNLTDMQNAQLVYEGKAKNGAKIPKANGGYKSKKQYDPITGEPLMYDKPVGGKRLKSTTQRKSSYIAPIDPMAQTSQRFLNTPNPWDTKEPIIPGTGVQNGPVLLPTDTTDDTGQYQWDGQPSLPEVKPYDQLEKDGTEAKKPFKKGLRNKFHIGDYLGEIATLFDKPEPVQSMQVNPILEPEYNLSLQQKKNSILSAYRPAMIASANSAGQQAAIAGQMAEQLAAVDSEELAMNQQNTGAIRARNLQEVRGTRDMNTQLGQQQYMQQQQARAITDQNRFNAANSISSKEAQRRAQNNNLSMYEQYTGWAWDPNTKQYQMIHPGYQFDEITAHAPSIDTEVEKKKKSKEWNYDPKTGKPLKQTELIETAMMGGMMSGPMPGMGGAPMAARKKKAKMGKKLKYC